MSQLIEGGQDEAVLEGHLWKRLDVLLDDPVQRLVTLDEETLGQLPGLLQPAEGGLDLVDLELMLGHHRQALGGDQAHVGDHPLQHDPSGRLLVELGLGGEHIQVVGVPNDIETLVKGVEGGFEVVPAHLRRLHQLPTGDALVLVHHLDDVGHIVCDGPALGHLVDEHIPPGGEHQVGGDHQARHQVSRFDVTFELAHLADPEGGFEVRPKPTHGFGRLHHTGEL